MSPENSSPKTARRRAMVTGTLLVLIALIVVIDHQRRQLSAKVNEHTMQVQQEQGTGDNEKKAQEVIEKVRMHMELSLDPEPTVAAVVDAEILAKEHEFYSQAKNGDFIVITSKRAILYREEEDKIIDVIPVELGSEEKE